YALFATAKKTSSVDWGAAEYCAWKDGGAPSDPAATPDDACRQATADEDVPPFGPKKPIRCIDWCDARAYCQWMGKELCVQAGGLAGQKDQVPQVAGLKKQFDWACGASPNDPYPSGLRADGACRLGGACTTVGIVT